MIFSKKVYDINNKMDVYKALYTSQLVLLHALAAFAKIDFIQQKDAFLTSSKIVSHFEDISVNQKYKVVDINDEFFAIYWEIP